MFRLLFSSRWLALIWGALMLGSAAMFVGKDGAVEQLGKTMEQVAAQQRELSESQPMAIEPDIEEPVEPPAFAEDALDLEGQIIVDPQTGQRYRIVRGSLPAGYAPVGPD